MITTFLGGGNMAAAMIGGLLQGGFRNDELRVCEPDRLRAEQLTRDFGVQTHAQAAEWMASSDIVVLAVKPQDARAALEAARPHIGGALLLSIAAGVRAASLARWIGHRNIVRAMPNTPALIRCGITGAVASPAVGVEGRSTAQRVLQAVGEVVWLDDERLLDPVTALSGSGPAYVFYFAEAMQRAGGELGLSAEQARALVVATFAGAAQLAAQSHESLAELRARVTSKGGTTAAALASLEADQVSGAIARAVRAADARARVMGDELDV